MYRVEVLADMLLDHIVALADETDTYPGDPEKLIVGLSRLRSLTDLFRDEINKRINIGKSKEPLYVELAQNSGAVQNRPRNTE